jgi:hypothetical protein
MLLRVAVRMRPEAPLRPRYQVTLCTEISRIITGIVKPRTVPNGNMEGVREYHTCEKRVICLEQRSYCNALHKGYHMVGPFIPMLYLVRKVPKL